MKNLGKFHSYQPENPEFPGANYICNGEGVDWYSISWDEERIAGKVYVGVDDNGVILSATGDGSRLFPVHMTVWEMPESEMPSGLLTDWSDTTLINGVFSTNYTTKAESYRQSLLNSANSIIADWRTELQLGSINDDDRTSLIKWMLYIKEIKALDFSKVSSKEEFETIKWPSI
ncbi:tail fiber assembly protein [Enterobacter sp. UPMP2052]